MKAMFASALAVLATACSAPVSASECAPTPVALQNLAERYDETPVLVGVRRDGVQILFLGAPEGGTFTTFIVRSDGIACVLVYGEAWAIIDPTDPAQPESPDGTEN